MFKIWLCFYIAKSEVLHQSSCTVVQLYICMSSGCRVVQSVQPSSLSSCRVFQLFSMSSLSSCPVCPVVLSVQSHLCKTDCRLDRPDNWTGWMTGQTGQLGGWTWGSQITKQCWTTGWFDN